MVWFKRPGSPEPVLDHSCPITISAGGALYTVTRGALSHLASHPIFGPMASGTAAANAEDGSYMIDCDGTLFRHILNYLRTGGGKPLDDPAGGYSRGNATSSDHGGVAGHLNGPPQQGKKNADGKAEGAHQQQPELCLPEDFTEWAQLLAEARSLQLPDLEEQILSRYEYQRVLFLRTLPSGVCVRWPTTVILCGSGANRDSGGGTTVVTSTTTATTAAAPSRAGAASSSRLLASASGSEGGGGGIGLASSIGSPTAGPGGDRCGSASTPTQPNPYSNITTNGSGVPSSSKRGEHLARSALRVSINPPLPSLRIAEDGRTVLYGVDREPVQDLDTLITLLLSAYGYHIQHWQEREGKVFLSLPSHNGV